MTDALKRNKEKRNDFDGFYVVASTYDQKMAAKTNDAVSIFRLHLITGKPEGTKQHFYSPNYIYVSVLLRFFSSSGLPRQHSQHISAKHS